MHFFSELTLLNAQTSADGYGPDTTDITNKYRVSNPFTVSSKARVFACQDSMMIVQPYVDVATGTVNNDLVNVILKPISALQIPFRSVKYYLYRGLAKNTFVAGTAITPFNSPDRTEFIDNLWLRWTQYKINTAQPGLNDPTPKCFGFDPTLAGTIMVEELFSSRASNNSFINELQAIKVKEGEWIGNIAVSTEFNFEIITDTDHMTINLDYVRQSKEIINVSGLTGGTPTPEVNFLIRYQREKILNYLDAAAFFGMHYTAGVKITTYTGAQKSTVKKIGNDIYTLILTKFLSKNRIYIDIRNEKGYSYNYYRNYGGGAAFLMKVKAQPAPDFIDDPYYTNQWPLFFSNSQLNSKVIQIQLRVDDNIQPVLFIENPTLLGKTNKNNFITETGLLNGTAVDWTKIVKLEIPNYVSGTTQENIAHHIQLQYFKSKDHASPPTTVFKTANYLDGIFGEVLYPLITVPSKFNHLKSNKRLLAQGNAYAYVTENGIYYDADKIVYCAANAFSLKKSRNVYPKLNFAAYSFTQPVSNPILPQHILYNRWQVNDGTSDINILEIVGFNKNHNTTPEEDIFFLGLTRAELLTLEILPGISDFHHKFFVFEEITGQADVNTGTPYKKYKVKIQGLNNVGEVIMPPPSPEVFVYGSGLNMLCSKDFAAASGLPNLLPDPGSITEFDKVETFSYDANDPFITGFIPGGEVKVDDRDLKVKKRARAGIIGEIFYPVNNLGDLTPSNKKATYPCVVILHGNGHRYTDYRPLCTFLAQNGFIVASASVLQFEGTVKVPLTHAPSVHTNYYYFIADNFFIYNNDPGPSGDPNYQYQKITSIIEVSIPAAPPTSAFLLPYVKGVDFDIRVDSAGTPVEITFKNKIGAHGMGGPGRANLLYTHLKVLDRKFNTPIVRLQNNIGIIGHSRGGESVVRAAKDIATSSAPAGLKNIKAIISLAPTDQYDIETLTHPIPYYVLYGSEDNDISGLIKSQSISYRHVGGTIAYLGTGFSLYDRANNNTEKSMSFVYGATHNGFITENKIDDPFGIPIAESIQQNIAKAYMNAFLRMHLKNEPVWKPIFEGRHIPLSVATKEVFQQYKKMSSDTKMLKDFDGASVGTISHSAGITITEGELNLKVISITKSSPLVVTSITDNDSTRIDEYSPHQTKGLKIEWAASESLTLTLPGGPDVGINVSTLKCISFRVGKVVDIPYLGVSTGFIPPHAAYSSLDGMKVKLKDTDSHEHAVALSRKVPDPYKRETYIVPSFETPPSPLYTNVSKSAMMTIRIDLANYSGANVNLTKIKEVTLQFPSSGSGTVVIDEISFSN